MILYPVLLPVPKAARRLSGKPRVAELSRIAREALKFSADRSGVVLGHLLKDGNDVPLPFEGNYWSISHKPEYVAAVVSKCRIGIDVEEMSARSQSLFRAVASDAEWQLGPGRSWDTFFRYWTAKEAALKSVGVGIRGLKMCRVVSVPDGNHIVLSYEDSLFRVEQLRYDNHIISVTKDDNEIKWVVAEDGGP